MTADIPGSAFPIAWRCEVHGSYASVIDDGRKPQFFCPTCERLHRAAFAGWSDQWDLHRRWRGTGIPTRFCNRTFDNFRLTSSNKTPFAIVKRFVEDFPAHLEQGTGVLLAGDMGTGKTHLAASALTDILRAGHCAAFVSAADYLAGLKPGHRGDEIDANHLASVALLVIDDIGSTRISEWSVSVLSELFATRYDDRRPTIVTTNSTNLAAHVGDRVVDRFDEMMLTAKLVGKSYRQQVADDEDLRAAPWAIPEPPREFESQRCSAGTMVRKSYRMGARSPEPMP